MNASSSLPSSARAHAARRLLAAGATLTALGIVLSLGSGSDLASLLTVVGLALTIVGLHRVGRLGPDSGTRRPRRGATRVRSRS